MERVKDAFALVDFSVELLKAVQNLLLSLGLLKNVVCVSSKKNEAKTEFGSPHDFLSLFTLLTASLQRVRT